MPFMLPVGRLNTPRPTSDPAARVPTNAKARPMPQSLRGVKWAIKANKFRDDRVPGWIAAGSIHGWWELLHPNKSKDPTSHAYKLFLEPVCDRDSKQHL